MRAAMIFSFLLFGGAGLAESCGAPPAAPQDEFVTGDGRSDVSFGIRNGFEESLFSVDYDVDQETVPENTSVRGEMFGAVCRDERVPANQEILFPPVIRAPVGVVVHVNIYATSAGIEREFECSLVISERAAPSAECWLDYDWDDALAEFSVGCGCV